MNNTELLKQYSTQLSKLKGQLQSFNDERSKINDSISLLNKQISEVTKKLNSLTQREVVISEHALLRYFERIKGFNLEDVKKEILDNKTKNLILFLNNSKGKIPWNGSTLVVDNNKIITIET